MCHNVKFLPHITLLQQEDEIMEATEGLSEAAKLLDQSVAIFAQLANSDRVSSWIITETLYCVYNVVAFILIIMKLNSYNKPYINS